MLITILIQAVLLLYHQTTTWCDFFPFNGVRFTRDGERRGEAAVNFVLMSLPIVGFGFAFEPLMKFGVAYYFILFAVECATWWAPYFFGASQKWLDVYTRVHSQTVTVLRRRGGNPAPNLEHLILMVLTLIVAIVTWRTYREFHGGLVPSLWPGWAVGGILTAGTLSQMVGKAKSPSNNIEAPRRVEANDSI